MSERLTGQLTSDCHTLIDMDATPIGMVEIFGAEYETDIATAKRLAACWNACEGVSDEDLASGVVSIAHLKRLVEARKAKSSNPAARVALGSLLLDLEGGAT
jgi:hypothetical protein